MPAKNKKNRTTSSARYILHLPIHDEHGNHLRDLASVGGQWLTQKIPNLIHSIHSEGPHQGHDGVFKHLHVLAYDTPETDSHVKQLGAHVGELTNHRVIHIFKEGNQGLVPWQIANRSYDGGSARPEAIAFVSSGV